ncbi:Uncharacterised protein [Mycobacterium tuberculosis]|nr:Uncharacterised protein [Mycobacterium tuberculosis]
MHDVRMGVDQVLTSLSHRSFVVSDHQAVVRKRRLCHQCDRMLRQVTSAEPYVEELVDQVRQVIR